MKETRYAQHAAWRRPPPPRPRGRRKIRRIFRFFCRGKNCKFSVFFVEEKILHPLRRPKNRHPGRRRRVGSQSSSAVALPNPRRVKMASRSRTASPPCSSFAFLGKIFSRLFPVGKIFYTPIYSRMLSLPVGVRQFSTPPPSASAPEFSVSVSCQ